MKGKFCKKKRNYNEFVLKLPSTDSYTVYSVVPTTINHVSYLKRLENNPAFDFWSESRALNGNVDVMVSPEAQKLFEEQLLAHGIQYSVMINNVER